MALDYTHAPHGAVNWLETDRRRDYGANGYFDRRGEITMIAVHHAAGDAGVAGVNTYHQQQNWCNPPVVCHAPHITYHYYIERSGTIYRCNYHWEESWHARHANAVALGICLQGNCDRRAPTAAQREALLWLLDALRRDLGLARSAVWGHGELTQYGNSTTCPGKHLLPLVKQYRAASEPPPAPVTQPLPEPQPEDWRVRYIELYGVTERHKRTLERIAAGAEPEASRLARAALAGQWEE